VSDPALRNLHANSLVNTTCPQNIRPPRARNNPAFDYVLPTPHPPAATLPACARDASVWHCLPAR
jgi:hypothetical protein